MGACKSLTEITSVLFSRCFSFPSVVLTKICPEIGLREYQPGGASVFLKSVIGVTHVWVFQNVLHHVGIAWFLSVAHAPNLAAVAADDVEQILVDCVNTDTIGAPHWRWSEDLLVKAIEVKHRNVPTEDFRELDRGKYLARCRCRRRRHWAGRKYSQAWTRARSYWFRQSCFE